MGIHGFAGISPTRWAPIPVISGVITPISRVNFHPSETQVFSAIYRGAHLVGYFDTCEVRGLIELGVVENI